MKSRKTKILMLVMVLALLIFAACTNNTEPSSEVQSSSETSTEQSETMDKPHSSSQQLPYDIGQVSIISSNAEFKPYEHMVSAAIVVDGQMTNGCGTFLSLEEVSDSLPEIQYADDFQVIVEGQDAEAITYSLYNDEFENLYSNQNDFSIPSEAGIYLLFVGVTWSNGEPVQQYKEYTLNEYLFKVNVSHLSSSQSGLSQQQPSMPTQEKSTISSNPPDLSDFVKDEAYNLYSKIESCSIENDVMTVVFSAYAENPVKVEVLMDAWLSDDNSAGQVNETFSIDKLKEYSISMSSSWFDENHTKGTTYMVNVYISTPTYTTTTHRFHFRDGKISQAASSSEKKSENPPQIAITIDGQAIEYTTGLNEWNGAIYDRLDTLQYILSERSGIVVPYVKLGGTIEIEFKDNPPASVKLYDDVIDENGNNRYSSRETVNIPVELKDRKLSFKFTAHPASMLSSNSNDYENGKTYRGFKLRCKWDNGNDCEYGFVIRTDYK